jgi:parallel beta-helix repeat protein
MAMSGARGFVLRWLVAVALLPVALPSPALAETQVCTTIAALPFDITVAGHYCLEQDLTVDGTAINISADNVVLDCNQHRITSQSAGLYNGIYAWNTPENVVVRNCVMEDFGGAIYFAGSSDPGALGNLVEGNTVLRSGAYGIQVWGSNNRIERNRVSGNTGSSNGQAEGIVLIGPGNNSCCNEIRDNVVSDFKPGVPTSSLTIQGIAFSGVTQTEVTGNTVSGLYARTGSNVDAISSQGSTGSLIARNTVLSAPPLAAPFDGEQTYGIVVFGPTEAIQTDTCRDNVVGHFVVNLAGCTDSVNTDF